MEEKYMKFYESVKLFLIDTNLSSRSEIEGETTFTLNQFEKDYQIRLPSSVYSYLLIFGKENKIRRIESEQFFTLSNIKKAIEVAERGNYKKILSNSEGLQDYNGDDGDVKVVYQLVNLNKVIFINQSDFRDGIGFVDGSFENPAIHYLFQKEYYLDENKSMTNYLRDLLFLAIQPRFYSDSEDLTNYTFSMLNRWNETQELSIDKLTWAKFYTDKKDLLYKPQHYYRKHRLDFYKLVSKQEEKTGYIMTIDEFELALIEYLRGLGLP